MKQIASTHPRITRIMSSRIKVTPKGIVCNGKTLDFETCEDAGLRGKVRCKGEGGGGVCLHVAFEEGGGVGGGRAC